MLAEQDVRSANGRVLHCSENAHCGQRQTITNSEERNSAVTCSRYTARQFWGRQTEYRLQPIIVEAQHGSMLKRGGHGTRPRNAIRNAGCDAAMYSTRTVEQSSLLMEQ